MGDPIHVLVIDDNPADRFLVAQSLEQGTMQARLREAGDAASGVDACRDTHFDCVLLDCRLPDREGLDILPELVAAHDDPIAVIAMTGLPNDELPFEMLRAGATDFLGKDEITPQVLDRALRYALARNAFSREATAQQREVSDLRQALAMQRSMTGWQRGSETARAYGVGPLVETAAPAMQAMQHEYEALLDEYLEALGMREHEPPRDRITEMATRLGRLGAGPRDVVDLHLRAVAAKRKHVGARRALALVTMGRLQALELMGNLVDYYRLGGQLSSNGRKP